MTERSSYGGWEVSIGYEEFVAEAAAELAQKAPKVLADLSSDTVSETVHHPNGFLVKPLENNEFGQLRLHIWPTGRVDDLTPHSHPWHLASRVLVGTYVEYLPEVQIDRLSPHELIVPRYNAERVQEEFTAGTTVRFELGEPEAYHAGEDHFLPAGAFHCTPLPVAEPFITLVRTGPQLFDTPSFVKRQHNVEEQMTITNDRRHPTDQEVEAIWRQIERITGTTE